MSPTYFWFVRRRGRGARGSGRGDGVAVAGHRHGVAVVAGRGGLGWPVAGPRVALTGLQHESALPKSVGVRHFRRVYVLTIRRRCRRLMSQADHENKARLERARAIGLFRYMLIREAADPSLTPRQRGAPGNGICAGH